MNKILKVFHINELEPLAAEFSLAFDIPARDVKAYNRGASLTSPAFPYNSFSDNWLLWLINGKSIYGRFTRLTQDCSLHVSKLVKLLRYNGS